MPTNRGLRMNERFARAAAVACIELAHEPDFIVGRARVRPSHREIACNGRREIVDPRVMQVLVALARADGGVVSRDDLIESCWGGVVVGEDAITNCVGRLRKVAETGGNAFTIETVPRVGYRLNVAELTATGSDTIPAEDHGTGILPGPLAVAELPQKRRPQWLAVLAGTILLLAAVGLGLWRFWPVKRVQAPAAPVAASVAVLPFVNMSGDPKQEYFSDGFSEELINNLANEPHLLVASRTSSFAFKGKSENVGTIARALNAHAIVEGSIRQAGDRVRVTAQLIDASDGYHLWSADYTRKLTDILSLQDQLAGAIATALTHKLVPAPAAPRPKIDPAVYRLYLKGIDQFNMREPMGWRMALATFKQVTENAPDFADGFAWLSIVADDLALNFDAAPASGYALAEEAATRALALDARNIQARAVLEFVALTTWNWGKAARNLRILRHQAPDSTITISGLRNYYSLLGFPDEALVQWRHLFAIAADTYRDDFETVWALDIAGRFQEEIGVLRAQLVHKRGDTFRLDYLCGAYAVTGQIAEARAVAEHLRSLQTDSDSRSNFQDCQWSIDLATGNRADALRILHIWESGFPDKMVHAGDFGADYLLLGDFEKASEWVERAYERREGRLFRIFFLKGFGYERAIAKYRQTAGYKLLAAKPLFKEWQAEHDRIAAILAAHRDPLSVP